MPGGRLSFNRGLHIGNSVDLEPESWATTLFQPIGRLITIAS